MYGQGGGSVLGTSTTAVSGVATTVAGIAVLPNTGGNTALAILSIATITIGGLVSASFVLTRIVARFYR